MGREEDDDDEEEEGGWRLVFGKQSRFEGGGRYSMMVAAIRRVSVCLLSVCLLRFDVDRDMREEVDE